MLNAPRFEEVKKLAPVAWFLRLVKEKVIVERLLVYLKEDMLFLAGDVVVIEDNPDQVGLAAQGMSDLQDDIAREVVVSQEGGPPFRARLAPQVALQIPRGPVFHRRGVEADLFKIGHNGYLDGIHKGRFARSVIACY